MLWVNFFKFVFTLVKKKNFFFFQRKFSYKYFFRLGPIANAPIDTIKTRIQRSSSPEKGWVRFKSVTLDLIRKEGYSALYKGLFPRLMRVGIGQAVTFASYERIKILLAEISQKGFFGAIEESI